MYFGIGSPKDLAEESIIITKPTQRNAKLMMEKQKLTVDKKKWKRENEKLARENEKLTRDRQKLTQENEKLARENEKLTRDKQKLTQENEKLARENEELRHENEELTPRRCDLTPESNHATFDHSSRSHMSPYKRFYELNPENIVVGKKKDYQVTPIKSIPIIPISTPETSSGKVVFQMKRDNTDTLRVPFGIDPPKEGNKSCRELKVIVRRQADKNQCLISFIERLGAHTEEKILERSTEFFDRKQTKVDMDHTFTSPCAPKKTPDREEDRDTCLVKVRTFVDGKNKTKVEKIVDGKIVPAELDEIRANTEVMLVGRYSKWLHRPKHGDHIDLDHIDLEHMLITNPISTKPAFYLGPGMEIEYIAREDFEKHDARGINNKPLTAEENRVVSSPGVPRLI